LNRTRESLSAREIGVSGFLNGIEINVSAAGFAMFTAPMVQSFVQMTVFLTWTEIGVKHAAFAIENAGLEPSAWLRRSRYG
jgi:hypothetical protein